jgi:hypothetical protein
MENYEGFDAIRIFWMGTITTSLNNVYSLDVRAEVIPLSDVAENGIPKIMKMYYPRYSKPPMFVKPFKIEFVNLQEKK